MIRFLIAVFLWCFATANILADDRAAEELDFSQLKSGEVIHLKGYSLKMLPAKSTLKGAVFAIQGLNNDFSALKSVSKIISEQGYNYYEVLLPGNDKNQHSARYENWIKAAKLLDNLARSDKIHHERGGYKAFALGYSTGSAVWLSYLKHTHKASMDGYILLAPPTNLRPSFEIMRFFLSPMLWFKSFNLGLRGDVPKELRAHEKTSVWSHDALLKMIDEMSNIDEFTRNFPKANITAILVSLDEFTHIDKAYSFFKRINADFRVLSCDENQKIPYRHLFITPKYGGKNNFIVLTRILKELLP